MCLFFFVLKNDVCCVSIAHRVTEIAKRPRKLSDQKKMITEPRLKLYDFALHTTTKKNIFKSFLQSKRFFCVHVFNVFFFFFL